MRIALVFVLLSSVAVAAEPGKTAEQRFKNIQVLKGVPAGELLPAMEVMSAALGVGCNNCHVDGAPEKDDKEAKRTARKMVTMMQKINHDFFGGAVEVTCATCHNGRAEPRNVPSLERAAPVAEEKPAAKPTQTAPQLLARWLSASGGAAAWQKLRGRVAKAKVEGFGPQPFPEEVVQAPPERWRMTLTMPNATFAQAWDGKRGWRAWGGQLMPLDEVGEVRRQAQFAPPVTLPKLLTDAKVRPDARVGDRAAHVVEGRDGDATVRLWLDAESGLLVRLSVRVPTPVGELPQQVDYSDYRTVDGVKLPFVVKTSMGGQLSTTTYTEIKHDVPVDAASFEPPQGK